MKEPENLSSNAEIDLEIDRFVEETKKFNGKEVREREAWNTLVTADSIRQFSYGIGDDNPLWIDRNHAVYQQLGKHLAPPAYLTSVLYPILHGAPIDVPLTNLIGEIEYSWYLPILEGDRLTSRSVQRNVYDSRTQAGNRTINIVSEVNYWNQRAKLVGTASGTMLRAYRPNKELLTNREIYRYTPQELNDIFALIHDERTKLTQKIGDCEGLVSGMNLGIFVRGPLTIGDMVCWQAGAGPSYRGGILGYLDLLKAPQTKVINPVTGWPVKFSHQHEDYLMAADRGMPAPFDNGVMRFAQVSGILTGIIGGDSRLTRLKVQILGPNLYGDATFYSVDVIDKEDRDDHHLLRVRVTGKNQLQSVTTTATADLLFPADKNTRTYIQACLSQFAAERMHEEGACAHGLFESRATRLPEKTAVTDDTTQLSYSQLDQLANQLAHWLQEAGVEKGRFVGIYLDRGHINVAAILAVLKIGGVYVPMDTQYPEERLLEMIADTPMTAIITQSSYDALFSFTHMRILSVDSFSENREKYATEKPDITVSENDLAYVMFTSGSVGRPKSVAVRHGSMVTYVDALRRTLLRDEVDHVFLHTATSAFSASTRQTFLPLCTGNTLVVASEEQRKDPIRLFKLIRERNVSVWDTVPAILHFFLRSLDSMSVERRKELLPNTLQYIFSTGQAMSWTIPALWYQKLGQSATIVNLYSQTETAGTVCAYHVPVDGIQPGGMVPIGFHLPDTPVYLLDENLQEVEPETIGEIVVSGSRISDGYLNHPELSNQRYLFDPFNGGDGAVMFRTGDLGMVNPDGILEITGRLDEKIKIRGIGVELADIEKVLVQIPGVDLGVVVAKGDERGDYKLFSFVVPHKDKILDPSEIRNGLKDKLPPHMVPVSVEVLEELPLGPNGKIDKSRLHISTPSSAAGQTVTGAQSVVDQLCRIWEDVLDLHRVEPDEDFFDIGGNSLLVVEMADCVEKMFGSRIAITDLAEANTVNRLARLIENGTEAESTSPVVLLNRGGNRKPLFCVPGIGGHLMRHQDLGKYFDNNQPFYGIQAAGYDKNLQRFEHIEGIASYYLKELKKVQQDGPYYLCGTCFGGVVAYEIARQLIENREEVAMLILVETRAPDRIIPRSMLIGEQLEQCYGWLQRRLRSGAENKAAARKKEDFAQTSEEKDTSPDKKVQPNLELKRTLRKARRMYRPEIIPAEVIVYRVKESPYRRKVLDRRLAWKRVAGGGFKEFWIPGNHLTMLEEPLVKHLGELLKDHLMRAQKSSPYQRT